MFVSKGPKQLVRALNARFRSMLAYSVCCIRFALRYRRLDAHNLAVISMSGYFDAHYYLGAYKDVADAGIDPVVHYLDFGASEQRNPSSKFNTAFYRWQLYGVQELKINPLTHFLRHGRRRGLMPTRKPAIEGSSATPNCEGSAAPIAQVSQSCSIRCVVFTAIVGDYDELQPVRFHAPNCEFVAFCDRPIKVDGWTVLPLNYFHFDPTRAARFVKLHPHLYFPDFDHSIWLDANLEIVKDVTPFLNTLGRDCVMSSFQHPQRGCIYEEGVACVSLRKDDLKTIFEQLRRHEIAGVPENIGLWETNVLVRRHTDPRCISLMTAWWNELQIGSKRDQISLPVVARAHGAKIASLSGFGSSAHDCPSLVPRAHKRNVGSYALEQGPSALGVRAAVGPLTIGVCVHNSLPEVRMCLTAAIAACHTGDKIIIVDDASSDDTVDFLVEFARHDCVELVRNTRNLGYTRSANIVLSRASTEWIILLNSDTVAPVGAFHKLVAAGERFSKIAIVGPLSNAAGWQTVPKMVGDDGQFLVNALPPNMSPADMDEVCERLSSGVVLFVPLVNGFCLALRRSALRTIGHFDDQSFPFGYGEEDDLCLRASDMGYACAIATDAYVYHSKSSSFTAARRQTLVAASGVNLRLKHGIARLAASVATMRNHPKLDKLRADLAIAITSRVQNPNMKTGDEKPEMQKDSHYTCITVPLPRHPL